MYCGHITFLSGIDKHGSTPPIGFPFRFAVLTWLECDAATADPWPLIRQATPRLSRFVRADSITVEYWERRRTGFLRRRWKERKLNEVRWDTLVNLNDRDLFNEPFPSRMRFLRNGVVVLHEESEMWNLIGGPSPYHDSVTLSFFSARPMDEQIRRVFTEEAMKLGLSVGQMG